MKHQRYWSLAAAVAVALLAAGALAAAEEHVWVSKDGHEHRLHAGGHAMFLGEDDADAFDVADLADGERRVIGEGPKQIVAERNGDEVTLTREADGTEGALSITCHLSTDTCRVLTTDGDDGHAMVMIQKGRSCEDGDGDCNVHILSSDVLPDGATHIAIRQVIHCDDDEECLGLHDVSEHAAGIAEAMVHVETLGHHGEGKVLFLGDGEHGSVVKIVGDEVVLGCPEGDARLTVSQDEADGVFLCPKHSVAMEKIERPQLRRLRFETKSSRGD